MTPNTIKKLRADAKPTTHLDRYERATRIDVVRVLDVACPVCQAKVGDQCKISFIRS